MSEELKPASVHDANVFLPGSLGPVRREVVLAYEHDRVVYQLREELDAIKAGQGEAITEVSAETFSSDGTSDIITCNLPIGTKLYLSAPPASADAVSVPPEWRDMLEELQWQHRDHDDDYHNPAGFYCPSCFASQEAGHVSQCRIRALLVQSQEVKP